MCKYTLHATTDNIQWVRKPISKLITKFLNLSTRLISPSVIDLHRIVFLPLVLSSLQNQNSRCESSTLRSRVDHFQEVTSSRKIKRLLGNVGNLCVIPIIKRVRYRYDGELLTNSNGSSVYCNTALVRSKEFNCLRNLYFAILADANELDPTRVSTDLLDALDIRASKECYSKILAHQQRSKRRSHLIRARKLWGFSFKNYTRLSESLGNNFP